MTTTQHTPGPWMIDERNNIGGAVIHNGDRQGHIATVNPSRGGMEPDGKANTTLILAAPDMHEACRLAFDYLHARWDETGGKGCADAINLNNLLTLILNRIDEVAK